MATIAFPKNLKGLHIHLVGAKGTGMTALAEILHTRGALLTGSDVADVFYTDGILHALGVRLFESFDARHVPEETDIIIYSAAYSLAANPSSKWPHSVIFLFSAIRRRSVLYLSTADRPAIAGVHGKTTTTAMAGILMEALSMPATVLAGSAISNFNGHCTLIRGSDYFIAETCEYRKHFSQLQTILDSAHLGRERSSGLFPYL